MSRSARIGFDSERSTTSASSVTEGTVLCRYAVRLDINSSVLWSKLPAVQQGDHLATHLDRPPTH